MKKHYTSVSLGGTATRHLVRLTSNPCEEFSVEYRFYQFEMLRHLTDSMDMIRCGPGNFKKLQMFHNGEHWVIEMEAVEEHA